MQPRCVRRHLQSPLSGSPDPDAAVKQALSHSVRTAGELPAELSLVRRTRRRTLSAMGSGLMVFQVQ